MENTCRLISTWNGYVSYLISERGVSPTTAEIYRRCIAMYLKSGKTEEEYYFDVLLNERYSSSFKHNMYFALKWHARMHNRPFNMKKNRLERKVRMNISLEKCWALLEAITEEDLKLAVYLALNTGLRPSEVLGLELGDIDFEEGYLLVKRTKTYRERIVPINKKTMVELKRFAYNNGIKGGRLFTMSRDRFSKLILRYSRKLGFKVTPYMLRHTFATLFVENNGNLLILKNIMGHSQISTTERYVHESKRMIKSGYDKACPEF